MATGRFCTNCGAQLDSDTQFCVLCGQSMGGEGQRAAVTDATVAQESSQVPVGFTVSTDASASQDAVNYAFPAQAMSPTSACMATGRPEPGRARRGGSGPAIAATVAIVLSAAAVLLCVLHLFVLPGATNHAGSVGSVNRTGSVESTDHAGSAGSADHAGSAGSQQEQAPHADPADNSSGNSSSQGSGSTTGQDASVSGAPKNSPTEGERDPGYRTGYHEPFWGVWTFASKSASEAMECATSMTAKGFDSTIELTTDWSNLNDEEWYVVTTGMWRDREEAERMVSSLRTAGYSDAYAKYSGEYVGDEG